MSTIAPLSSLLSAYQTAPAQPKTASSASLGQVTERFEEMLANLNQSQDNADSLLQQLAAGENVDLHTVMLGLEENNINFNLAIGIRDRLLETYREMMRMQV